jgi:L-fuconolactonase
MEHGMDRAAWRAQVKEEILDADLPIVDAHHHIWGTSPAEPWEPYDEHTVIADKTGSGHNIVGTIYVDSMANYRTDGPEHMRTVGEVEFVHGVAERANAKGGRAKGTCAAIVGAADLMLGAQVGEVLDAQIAASPRYSGIRYMTALDPDLPPIFGGRAYGEMTTPAFREGFAELVKRGLTFDAWAFHPQLPEVLDLARAFPEAKIVVDHTGGPIGVGRFLTDPEGTHAAWRIEMEALSNCPNVVLKLGGLNMTYTRLDATDQMRPNTSRQVADLQRDFILAAIDLFGPSRCMFESNFPVDMRSISYAVVWNSFKRMTQEFTTEERADLFAGTAMRFYGISSAALSA